MLLVLRKLFPGLALIALISGILLYSDLAGRSRSASSERKMRVAFVQHASQPVLDDAARGVMEAMAARGFVDGGRMQLQRYNAEGDTPTANAIAREVTAGNHDLVVTITTLSLQTVANANAKGAKTKHVFGCVSSPAGAGVGISAEKPLEHPPWMAGFGSMPPVDDCIQLARKINPSLRKLGVVWNPTESNSEAATKSARISCRKLGIELLEANVNSSNDVAESAASLVARGVEAIWVGGDVAVLGAFDMVVAAANRGKIPVFTVIPPSSQKGGLFDLGANYHEIGRMIGDLAADVLDGKDPALVPIENRMPETLVINRKTQAGLQGSWSFPADVMQRADITIEADGTRVEKQATATPAVAKPKAQPAAGLVRPARIDLVEFVDTVNVEMAREGLLAGLAAGGLVEGRDFELRRRSAQGDMATLSTMVDAAVSDQVDLLMTSTTPALQMALRRGKGLKTVFTLVADPKIAGAGKTDSEHLANFAGSYVPPPHDEAMPLVRAVLPNARRIGTLYVPSEVNSVFYKEDLERVARAAGIELVAVGITTTGEVPDAAMALCGRGIDAICQISDNMSGSCFASIAQAAKRSRIPLVSFASGQARQGAFLAVARDFRDNGEHSGLIAARVLRGESPAGIPFFPVQKMRVVLNVPAAAELGIQFSKEVLSKADEVIR